MALGLSGSNSGIAETYRALALEDIRSGLEKYRTLLESAPKQAKPLYALIVQDLDILRDRIRESKLEKL